MGKYISCILFCLAGTIFYTFTASNTNDCPLLREMIPVKKNFTMDRVSHFSNHFSFFITICNILCVFLLKNAGINQIHNTGRYFVKIKKNLCFCKKLFKNFLSMLQFVGQWFTVLRSKWMLPEGSYGSSTLYINSTGQPGVFSAKQRLFRTDRLVQLSNTSSGPLIVV